MKFMLQAFNLSNDQIAQFCERFYRIDNLIVPIIIIRPQTPDFIQNLLKSSIKVINNGQDLIPGLMTVIINPDVDVESEEDIDIKYLFDHFFDYYDAVMCEFYKKFEMIMEDDREEEIDIDYD